MFNSYDKEALNKIENTKKNETDVNIIDNDEIKHRLDLSIKKAEQTKNIEKQQIWMATKIELKASRREVQENLEMFDWISIISKRNITKNGDLIWVNKLRLEDIIHSWQKLSIKNNKWISKNVIWGKSNKWEMTYIFEWTKQRVNIFDGYKISAYNNIWIANKIDLKERNNYEQEETEENKLNQKNEFTKNKETFKNIELTKKDLIDFAAMIKAEAWWEWKIWMAAVAFVILNRMRLWWKSMSSVLFQESQFSPVANGEFSKTRKNINKNDLNFAKDILNWLVKNPVWIATFFQNERAERRKNNWQKKSKNLFLIWKVWNHIFRWEKSRRT